MFFDPAIVATLHLKEKTLKKKEPPHSTGLRFITLTEKTIKELGRYKTRGKTVTVNSFEGHDDAGEPAL